MFLAKLMKIVLLILVFLTAFFPICLNISAFARESINASKPQESAFASDMDELLSIYPERQKISKTIKAIEEELKEYPKNQVLYETLAFLCDYIGLYQQALEATKKSILYYPEDGGELGKLYGNLARQYLNLNRLDEAKPAIDKSLEYEPDNITNRTHLLQYYILKVRYREAGIQLKTITELAEEKNIDRDFYYDIYMYFIGRPDCRIDAVELFKEAVKVNPGSHLPHRTLGVAIRNSSFDDIGDNFPYIMKELKKSFKLNPEHVPTLITIADTYGLYALKTENKKYFEFAMEYFKKATELEPENTKLLHKISNMYIHIEQFDKEIETK